MLAYRAETAMAMAMANILRESLTRADEARTLLCSIYKTEAGLVRISAAHPLSWPER